MGNWLIDWCYCYYFWNASCKQADIARSHSLYCFSSLKNWGFLKFDQDMIEIHLICIWWELLNFLSIVVVWSQEGQASSHLSEMVAVFLGAHCPYFIQSGNTWFVIVQSQEGQVASHLLEIATFLGGTLSLFCSITNKLQTCEWRKICIIFGNLPWIIACMDAWISDCW